MLRDSKIKIIVECWKVPALILLALLLRFMPYGIYAMEKVKMFTISIKIIAIICSVVIVISSFKMNDFYFVLLSLVFINLLSTFINHQDVITYAWNTLSSMSMIVILEWGMKKDYQKCVDVLSVFFVLMLLLNLCLMIVNHEIDMSFNDHFLGNRNSFIIYGIPGLLFTGTKRYDDNTSFPWLWILTWIILIVSYILVPSSTSIIGLFCLLVFVLFLNKSWSRRIFNVYVYSLIVIAVFFVIIYRQESGWLTEMISQIMGKKPTFSGRVYIWRDYIKAIKESFLIGHGVVSGSDLPLVFSGTNSWNKAHAHNTILNTVFQTGIIGFVMYILLTVTSIRNLRQVRYEKLRYFFEALLGVLLLMSQFEAYSQELYFIVFGFIYFYSDRNMKEVNENEQPMSA